MRDILLLSIVARARRLRWRACNGRPARPSAETLQDAMALAYQTNPTIRAERARLNATREAKAQAWAGALPQISGKRFL